MKGIPILRLLTYVILTLAALAIVPVFAYDVLYRLRHPAPLGRNETDITTHVDAALPRGTSRDSAQRFLRNYDIEFESDSVPRALSAAPRDSLAADGPIVRIRLGDFDPGWFGCRAVSDIALYFTADDRLLHRRITFSTTGCL